MTPEDRIRALPIWPSPPTIRRIQAGRTNENFVVESGKHRFVARLGIDLPHHGINRRNEARMATLAADLGVGPPIRYARDGILVADFIDGRPLATSDLSVETLRRTADLLRRLHQGAAPADGPVFELRAVCRRYLSQIPSTELSDEHRQRISRTLDEVPILPTDAVIHADLVPENLIDDGERLWLVDWEYAGCGDAATDLAILAMNAELDPDMTAELVRSHGAVDLQTVRALRPAAAIREALWTLVQMQAVGARGDLPDYSRHCFARLGLPR
ncbi:MAG: choline kinase family protein [Rhodospirillales bacterium]|nr:choline kinase family protein [Rhodospirillales bacterium]